VRTLLALATLLAPSLLYPAIAAETTTANAYPGFSAGPTAGTLGLGGEVGVRINDYVGVRAGGSWFDYSFSDTPDDLKYDVDLTWSSFGAVVDVHPWGNGWRATAGFRLNGNDADLKGRSSGPVDIGGTTYQPAELGTVRGDLELNEFAPYLGVGYSTPLWRDRLELSFDAGVLFQGKPKASLKASGLLANDPQLIADLNEEANDIEDDLNWLEFYPVVGVALRYRLN